MSTLAADHAVFAVAVSFSEDSTTIALDDGRSISVQP